MIDRNELITILLDTLRGTTIPAVPLAEMILALEKGAMLITPEQAGRILGWYATHETGDMRELPEDHELADRLIRVAT